MVEKFFTQQIYSGQNKLIKDANCFKHTLDRYGNNPPQKTEFSLSKRKGTKNGPVTRTELEIIYFVNPTFLS